MPEERKEHANFGLKKEFVFFCYRANAAKSEEKSILQTRSREGRLERKSKEGRKVKGIEANENSDQLMQKQRPKKSHFSEIYLIEVVSMVAMRVVNHRILLLSHFPLALWV